MEKIRYLNLCIVEFGRRYRMSPRIAYNYLRQYNALKFIDEHYEAEHLLPLADTIKDMRLYCKKNGGTI